MTTLASELAEYVRACFSGVWIETYEPDEAITEIADEAFGRHGHFRDPDGNLWEVVWFDGGQ